MRKHLGLLALVLLLSGASFSALAQDEDASAALDAQILAGKERVSGTSAGSAYIGFGPINLTPGAFVLRQNGRADEVGAPKYQAPRANSAKAYNDTFVRARQMRIQQQQSIIPSPFPPGYSQ